MSKYFLDKFEADLNKKIAAIMGLEDCTLAVGPANEKFDADLAVAVFGIAKEQGQNPSELAGNLAAELEMGEVTKFNAVGGFLNIYLKPEVLAKNIAADFDSVKKYGEQGEQKEEQLAIVDYVGLNIAKPFSVGHLRPSLQGQAIINMLRATGYKVIGDTHLGDSGTPFGVWVVGYELLSSEELIESGGAYELGRVYSEMKKLLKEEEETGGDKYKNEVARWLNKLESGDKIALDYHARFNKISQEHMFGILDELGITPDENLGELFFLARGRELVAQYVNNGLAIKQDDGSIICKLEEFGIEVPILLEKSNGSSLYATTDIAAIAYRMSNYSQKPVKIVYSVDKQQRLHFEQVFAFAKKAGLVDDKTELTHAWFGQIQELSSEGKRQKMSSRSGAMNIRDLIDLAIKNAGLITEGRDDVGEQDVRKIALGAIKFNDFAQDRKKDILFDWERMFSLQGFSGPFVQYAGVRIKSILEKSGQEVGELSHAKLDYNFKPEKELLLKLALYPNVVKTSAERYEPHHLATYAFELAKELNRYYEEVNVLQSVDNEKKARLWLLGVVFKTLENCLGILGIEIPQKM